MHRTPDAGFVDSCTRNADQRITPNHERVHGHTPISDEVHLIERFTARGIVHTMAPSINTSHEAWDAFFVRVFHACNDVAEELKDSGMITGALWDEAGPELLRVWWLAMRSPLLEQWEAFMLRTIPTP